MKTFKLLLPLFFLLSCTFITPVNAQVDVTINPIGLLWGDLNVGADFVLKENISLEANIGIATGKEEGDDFKYFGMPITIFGKYYFNPKNGADRFYGDVFLRFVTRSFSYDGDGTSNFGETTSTRVGAGFGIGYKVVSVGGFVFDIGFGVGRAFVDKNKVKGDGDVYTFDWPDIMFVGKLAVGYRFGGGK